MLCFGFATPKELQKNTNAILTGIPVGKNWASLGMNLYVLLQLMRTGAHLRFRKAAHIKTMTRSFAMTEEGKKKVAAAKKK